jgi:peptidoglycan/xylan/chitin deacetylase (PgdA/CDA1 family)
MKKAKTILLTFDVEEFDTPLRHKIRLPKPAQLEKSEEGLQNVITLLQELKHPPCTFYTTANYALHYPDTIRYLANYHEIASHTFYHSSFKEKDIAESKICIEEIIGKEIQGFRMPNMAAFDPTLIHRAGYAYDSSINPTFLPGKYNHLKFPLRPFPYHGTTEIPVSVVPFIRFPLFWLSFKNLPLWLYIRLCNFTLWQTGCLHIYFHPWEFADLSMFKIPDFIKNPSGHKLSSKLKAFIQYYQQRSGVEFQTTIDFLNQRTSS